MPDNSVLHPAGFWVSGLPVLLVLLACLPGTQVLAQPWPAASKAFVRQDIGASRPAPVASAAQLYALHCAGCHRFDGEGQPAFGVPAMRGKLGHFMRTPEGRAFLVQVPGVNNAGLDDAQIAALTNWLLQTLAGESLPADWQPFRAEELPGLRAVRPVDFALARRRILDRLTGQADADTVGARPPAEGPRAR